MLNLEPMMMPLILKTVTLFLVNINCGYLKPTRMGVWFIHSSKPALITHMPEWTVIVIEKLELFFAILGDL